MANQIPKWLLGQHMSVLTITGMTCATTGVLSAATSSAMSSVRLRTNWQFHIDPMDEEINDDSSLWANHVTLADDWTASIEILATNDGNEPFKLNNLILSYEYFKVVTTFVKGASTKTLTLIGKRGPIGANSNGRSAFKESLDLRCIDTGTGADACVVWS